MLLDNIQAVALGAQVGYYNVGILIVYALARKLYLFREWRAVRLAVRRENFYGRPILYTVRLERLQGERESGRVLIRSCHVVKRRADHPLRRVRRARRERARGVSRY